jgi:hypothetical protein
MARLGTPVILLTIIGISYWYWSGPYQNSANTPLVDDTKRNAETMARCIAQENYAEAIRGDSGNVGSFGDDAEELCAHENNLVEIYGEWHRR